MINVAFFYGQLLPWQQSWIEYHPMDASGLHCSLGRLRKDNSMYLDRVIGHRGCAGLAPENSEAALRLAASLGVKAVEVDVALTREGMLPIFHDNSLSRCTNGRGSIRDADWNYLAALDNGSWFDRRFAGSRILQLDQLLALTTELGLMLNLELKVHDTEAEALASAVAERMEKRDEKNDNGLVVSSFSHAALEAYHRLQPRHAIGYLFEGIPSDWQSLAESVGAATIHADASRITEADVARVKTQGYPLFLYTLNQRRQFDRWITAGVDGVFTDYPDRFLGREH
ncbi:glycerophosphodiester phosphodiesterase family protein [Aestuariirhabdus litorea]|uniref:Glycerophosphoryl diester phosphodiesterase n=1 Tax=Aestuariirhabdus litorea TaxID=2528527 RepID=A0A3P3VVA7_9GAMM|nr:glycerophosphodiester phosphodiesterase family protein [Aestuariirhabdus litorea]RRJ84693.1 glycerophosphoryl diester phosphodiesterase [Aestuariirhabdus litorea]RWW97918.1 glycerophosphoryl diester phosphodiesterase [Endozoicomonadaceae bacterium GTF-13]